LQQLTVADLAILCCCASRTLEALRPAPGEPRLPAGLLVRIEPLKGIIREALLVLHAIAWHRFHPENLRDFRTIILQSQVSVDGKQDGFYPTPDAEIYAAMILDIGPLQIVEVGSGYSTLIARRAIQYATLPTKLAVIDPSPRTEIGELAPENETVG
jgi:hypothetical protein